MRVLVVENEWIIAQDFCHVLASEGAHVVGPAASVPHALALINECRIDTAVLDIHLGEGSDVYPVAELLRARNVPFIFATGYDPLRVRRDFVSSPHLRKPFGPSIISHILAVVSSTARRQYDYGLR